MTDTKIATDAATQSGQVAAAQRARNVAPANVDPQPAATQPMNPQEFQRAVGRMTQKLDNGQVRQDVQRGFYLNIRV